MTLAKYIFAVQDEVCSESEKKVNLHVVGPDCFGTPASRSR